MKYTVFIKEERDIEIEVEADSPEEAATLAQEAAYEEYVVGGDESITRIEDESGDEWELDSRTMKYAKFR